MDVTEVWEGLAGPGGAIIMVVMDGVGGLRAPGKSGTELEVADTPNLDRLAGDSSCGLLQIAGPGITPGSGPGHLALFGYDPLLYDIGRGVLSALGIDFPLERGDVAARINFATADVKGNITDRRAGRIATEVNAEICEQLVDGIDLGEEVDFFLEPVSEHRAVLVLRGPGLGAEIGDTDPQKTGVPALEPRALDEGSKRTEELLRSFLEQARELLRGRERANAILLRGFEEYEPLPTLHERFKLNGCCIAEYPMYRGISRLLGLDVLPRPEGVRGTFESLVENFDGGHDFFFVHLKKTDSYGENGDFDAKVSVIEEIDRSIHLAVELDPQVLIVTADHSTPALMKMHSWHPVPVLLKSPLARVDRVERFDELSCIGGSLGFQPGVYLMGQALAHAGRLEKYGA